MKSEDMSLHDITAIAETGAIRADAAVRAETTAAAREARQP
jgi:hypothetical protein